MQPAGSSIAYVYKYYRSVNNLVIDGTINSDEHKVYLMAITGI